VLRNEGELHVDSFAK
jgi:hypothetical protein